MAETTWKEKLGLRAQFPNYVVYIVNLAFLPMNVNLDPYAVASSLAGLIFFAHPMIAYHSNMRAQHYQMLSKFTTEHLPDLHISLPPHINPRDWKTACLPVVPVDKWVRGRRFLAKYGDELIIPRS